MNSVILIAAISFSENGWSYSYSWDQFIFTNFDIINFDFSNILMKNIYTLVNCEWMWMWIFKYAHALYSNVHTRILTNKLKTY